MKAAIAAVVGASAVLAGGASLAQASTPGLRIEHAAARVVVIPEPRANVSVTVQGGDARLPRLQVRTERGMIMIEGGLEHRIGGCGGFGIVFSHGPNRDSTMRVMIRGVGPLALERLPLITAHVPLEASVAAGEAVFGEVGAMNSLAFANTGCGDWTLGDVRGPLSVALSGSGDARGGRAGFVKAAMSGSGDLTLTEIGGLEANVAGSGDLRIRRVDGPLGARVAGSGDVSIDSGRTPNLAAEVAGSGDVHFGGEAGAVAVRVVGSGDVHVAHATGPVSRSVLGSGDVVVGR